MLYEEQRWRCIPSSANRRAICSTRYELTNRSDIFTLWLRLQHGRGTACHHRPGPPPRYWNFGGRPSLIRQSFGWRKSGTVSADWQLNCVYETCNIICAFLWSAPATVAEWWCHLNHYFFNNNNNKINHRPALLWRLYGSGTTYRTTNILTYLRIKTEDAAKRCAPQTQVAVT